MRILPACALLLFATVAHAADDSAAIRAEIDREAAAWNRGDLDAYLSGYERAPSTTMVGGKELVRGWDAIAARYRKNYYDKSHMGQLSFSELEVRPLGAGWALAIGHWALARDTSAGGPVGGWFTLTLRKTSEGWRIVIDHTS
jgi:uncharacterized protein (TIGR02246 family)